MAIGLTSTNLNSQAKYQHFKSILGLQRNSLTQSQLKLNRNERNAKSRIHSHETNGNITTWQSTRKINYLIRQKWLHPFVRH